MGINISRIGDIGSGVCCEDDDHDAIGIIISGAGTVNAEGINAARIGDVIISTSCGHERVGIIVDGSPTVYAEGANVARIGDTFDGCFSGTIIEGAGTVFGG